MRKAMTVLLMSLMLLSMVGFASAADITLTGMDTDKSIGNQGVMVFNETGVKGLCVDKYTYINFGDSVPVTTGTNGLTNASKVKTLIIQNYRPNMTAQEGYDLQGAIWYFTNNVQPANQAQQTMIDNAIADQTEYPDIYILFLSNETVLKNNQTTCSTEVIGETTSSESVITEIGKTSTSETNTIPNGQTVKESIVTKYLGQIVNTTTEVIDHGDKICTKTITTITNLYDLITTTITTDYFTNVTDTNTTTYYKNTTTTTKITNYLDTFTTTETYESTTKYLDFVFNSVQKKCKQQLILFTATPRTEVQEYTNTYNEYKEWNDTQVTVEEVLFNTTEKTSQSVDFSNSSEAVTNDPFNTTVENIETVCKDVSTNNTPDIPVKTRSIPMQATGIPLALLMLGIGLTAVGIVFKK